MSEIKRWRIAERRKKLLLFVGLFLLVSCSKELPNLKALTAQQLTHEVVLQARLSNSNEFAWVLTQGPILSQWDIAKSQVVHSIPANDLTPNTKLFTLSQAESRLLTSDGKSILLWELTNTAPELVGGLDFRPHLGDANISAMAFISDKEFVVGNTDGSFIFADLRNQLFRRSLFHSNEITKLLVNNDKTELYSAGNDGMVQVTDLQLLEKKYQYNTPFRITSLINNQDDSLIFLSDALEQQVIWRPGRNDVLMELDFFEQYRFFRLGMFLENDTKLLTTSPKTEVSLWDVKTGEEQARWQATSHSLGSAVVDLGLMGNEKLVTITSDTVIETWDLNSLIH